MPIPPAVPDFHFNAELGRVFFSCPAPCSAAGYLPAPRWQIVRLNPLTVSPSVHCTSCGTHGFITDGLWVPA